MSEMVEGVARAICQSFGMDPNGHPGQSQGEALKPNWILFEARAVAAIKAMREPTVRMVQAGSDCPIIDYDGNDPREVWQAMIDEALK